MYIYIFPPIQFLLGERGIRENSGRNDDDDGAAAADEEEDKKSFPFCASERERKNSQDTHHAINEGERGNFFLCAETDHPISAQHSELAREKMWGRIHLIPLLQAEEDRDLVRRTWADKARERELLGKETRVYHSDRWVLFFFLLSVHSVYLGWVGEG